MSEMRSKKDNRNWYTKTSNREIQHSELYLVLLNKIKQFEKHEYFTNEKYNH